MGIAERRGVGIIKIQIGREPETMADRCVQFDGTRKPESAGSGRAEHRPASAEDFLTKAQGKRAALGRTPFGLGVACSPVATVVAEVGAAYLIACLLQAVEYGGVFQKHTAVAQGAFQAVVDVLVLITAGLI